METVTKIDVEKVQSVYVGKAGRCCCGCSGKHTTASAYREARAKTRGYPVGDDEVNDKEVRRVVDKINARPEAVDMVEEGSFISAVFGNRLYIAYFAK